MLKEEYINCQMAKKIKFLAEYSPKKGGQQINEIITSGNFVHIGYIYFDTDQILSEKEEVDNRGNINFVYGNPIGTNKFNLYGNESYKNLKFNVQYDSTFASDYIGFSLTGNASNIKALNRDLHTTKTNYYRADEHIQKIELFDDYKVSPYAFALGINKDIEKMNEIEIMNNSLNIVNGKLLLKHNSNVKITDGFIDGRGKTKNSYSSNVDFTNYFWASKTDGPDPSGGGQYKYYCEINLSQFYNMNDNKEGFESVAQALRKYNYVGVMWLNTPKWVACVSEIKTPIKYIIYNGHVYNPNWTEIN